MGYADEATQHTQMYIYVYTYVYLCIQLCISTLLHRIDIPQLQTDIFQYIYAYVRLVS